MNNIINKAITSTNEARELEAIREIQGFLSCIEREQVGREATVKRIGENQAALKKIANEVTFESVLGTTRPATPTATEAAIIKAIEQTVKARVDSVEAKAKGLSDVIACDQDAVIATDKRITELREKMRAVTVKTVAPATVVG